VGRHAGSPRWAPSDRGLAIIQTWEGFGTLVLTAALLVIGLMVPSPSSPSWPSITQASATVSLQRVAIAINNLLVDNNAVRRAAVREDRYQMRSLGARLPSPPVAN
jgi:hypothetical protein